MMISDGGIPNKYIKKSTDHLKQNKEHNPSFLIFDGHFLGDDIVADTSITSKPFKNIGQFYFFITVI